MSCIKTSFKSKVFTAILVLMFAGVGSVKPDAPSGAVSLDNAIIALCKEIEDSFENGQRVSVADFKAESADFSDYLIETIMGCLIRGKKLTVVERQYFSLIDEEINFTLSGYVRDDNIPSLSAMDGAELIITGSCTGKGNMYQLRVVVLEVETKALRYSSTRKVKKE